MGRTAHQLISLNFVFKKNIHNLNEVKTFILAKCCDNGMKKRQLANGMPFAYLSQDSNTEKEIIQSVLKCKFERKIIASTTLGPTMKNFVN